MALLHLLSLLYVFLFELLSFCFTALLFLHLLMFFVLLRLQFLAFLLLLVVKLFLLLLDFLILLGVAGVRSSRTFCGRQVLRMRVSFGSVGFRASAVVFASHCVIAMEVAGLGGCNSCRATMVI